MACTHALNLVESIVSDGEDQHPNGGDGEQRLSPDLVERVLRPTVLASPAATSADDRHEQKLLGC